MEKTVGRTAKGERNGAGKFVIGRKKALQSVISLYIMCAAKIKNFFKKQGTFLRVAASNHPDAPERARRNLLKYKENCEL